MPAVEPGVTIFDAGATRERLPFVTLVETLRRAFAAGAKVPPRHHHYIARPGGSEGTLLLMLAWGARYLGVKMVTIFPGNSTGSRPASIRRICCGRRQRPAARADRRE